MQPFTLFIALALLAALLWLAISRSQERESTTAIDAALAASAGALLLGRAGFVLFHLSYYSQRPAEIAWFWQGGLSAFAAALGALLGLAAYAQLTGGSVWRLGDRLILPAQLPLFAAWLGCLLEGCAYGFKLPASSWVPPTPDLLGVAQPRWPVQSVGALATLAGLVLLLVLRQRLQSGFLLAIGLANHGALLLLLSLVRADPVPLLVGLRSDALGGAALLLIGLALLLTARTKQGG